MQTLLFTISHQLFEYLKEQVLFSTLIFLLVLFLSFIFRKKSPYLHYALWTLVLIRLVLPTDISAPWSARNLVSAIYQVIPKQVNAENNLLISDNTFVAEADNAILQVPNLENNIITIQNTLVAIWLIGIFLFLVVLLARLEHYRLLIKRSTPLNDKQLLQTIELWKRHFNIKRNIRLVETRGYHIPFTIGIINPVICLPHALASSEFTTIEPVIAHECAHIKRYDDIWLKLQYLIQVIYFFNPLVWYTNLRLNQSREILCDQMVLKNSALSRKQYGMGLIQVLKFNVAASNRIALLPEFGRNSQFIKNRLQQISRGRLMKTNNTIIRVGVLLLGLLVLPMAVYLPQVSAETPMPESVSKAEPSSISASQTEFVLPLETGRISADYGDQIDPFTQKKRFHSGIDIKSPKETSILASADGTVITVVTQYTINNGRGRYVVIQHENNVQTLYSHMQDVNVTLGQTVKTGEKIGSVGTTGKSTGPHLHFEILINNENVNPAEYVNFSNLDN